MAFSMMFRFAVPAGGNQDYSVNSSNNTYDRIMAMAQAVWGPVDDGAGGLRPMTEREVFHRVTQEMIRGINGQVRTYEGRKASDQVPPIDATEV